MLISTDRQREVAFFTPGACVEELDQPHAACLPESDGTISSHIDYDLHGIAGIRLVNASPDDAAAVARQLGPLKARLTREPDIIIKFVHRLSTSRVMYLGLNDAGFTDDAFLVLRSSREAGHKVQIPLGQVGQQCEIVCESGVGSVPLLISVLNLTMLSKGFLPLHASAFNYNGVGVLTTGWAKGGKTESLLAFMARGAVYVGDEWIYISPDGQYMYGIPQPIRVWDWHLEWLPKYRALVSRTDLLYLQALQIVRKMHSMMPKGKVPLPARALERIMPLLKRQLYVDMRPDRLFGDSFGTMTNKIDRLFLVASHEKDDVRVEPIDPIDIARRMVFSLQYERLDFMSFYYKFRFAFPEIRNELIEHAEELQREMLARVFAGKDSYVVYHPYPVAIPALFHAMDPFISR